MKKILITGKNSYVGNNLENWLNQYPEKYSIDKISLRDDSWKECDFSIYDVVVHVAGIAHVSTDPNMEELYYRVNRDLTIEVAKKSKAENVKQFIFLSSIIVYGDNPSKDGVIDEHTVPKPSNFYGRSKLEAEEGIKPLESEDFKVVIIRPPMIYGKDSKGNYPKLAAFARRFPVFPDFENKRSMIHIDNLTEFMKLMIDNKESGLFFPQNKEYVKTSELVRLIAEAHGKKVYLTKIFNPLLNIMINRVNIINKVFGSLIYAGNLCIYRGKYQIQDLRESISLTELESK